MGGSNEGRTTPTTPKHLRKELMASPVRMPHFTSGVLPVKGAKALCVEGGAEGLKEIALSLCEGKVLLLPPPSAPSAPQALSPRP